MDILQGTLDVLVLRTISGGSKHGYQIARAIKALSAEVLQVEEGALYPALHRLEERGCVVSRWGRSENKRRAKFYELTEEGRLALAREARSWDAYAEAVGRVLAEAPRDAT
ncbi:MAG: PadR family transcriptional regulator [Gemmatimonadetes bacterium]|nr:PadR family transcriptional regulator [Gemmatimonadota bacterium]